MSRRISHTALLILIVLAFSGQTSAGEPVRAEGALVWVFSDELDLVGDINVEIPFRVGDGSSLYFAVDTTTAIERTATDFTFIVRDVLYRADLGTRIGPWALFAGQRGRVLVDAPGHANIRYFGGGWETAGLRRPVIERTWDLGVDAGIVLDDQRIDADGFARGRFAWRKPWRKFRLGFDLSVDGLLSSSDFDADVRGGPRIGFVLPGGRYADLFVHYLDGNNPLGLQLSGVLAGIDLLEAPAEGMESLSGSSGDIDGTVALGGGDSRTFGRLRIRVVSPAFAGDWRGLIEVDGNVLRGDDNDELYYLYHAGLEKGWRNLWAGGYFYHRSNHLAATANDTITSINVLEGGLETGRYGRLREQSGLDWRLRAGYLLDSAFGEDERWHLRGGIRYLVRPGGGRWSPFLEAEGEAGDVERIIGRAGVLHRSGAGLHLEYLDEEQFFGADNTAWLLQATYRY
jgi:hypothetical protein